MRSGFLGGGIGPRAFGGGAADPVATFGVVTTGAQTLTIAELTVSAATTVDWGDGNSDTYTGSGARTHNYAGAGTWTVRVMQPLNVTTWNCQDAKVSRLNSADIACMNNITSFTSNSAQAGTFNSADVAHWNIVGVFNFAAMGAGYAGTFNTADVAHWRPTSIFQLGYTPVSYAIVFNTADLTGWGPIANVWIADMKGATGTFNTADVAAWNPVRLHLFSEPAGLTITAGGGFANWTALTEITMNNNALSQATVDAILWELYQAAKAPRTGVNGTINVAGSNAAPSGTFQACASPPVTAATPGKEIAHELLNDTIGAFSNHWATVMTS